MKTNLVNLDQARTAFRTAWDAVFSALNDGKVISLEVKQKRRSLSKNAKFHAICGDIAKSGFTWAGKERSLDEWKALLISGHAIANRRPAELVQGLEGEFVSIRESSANMDDARAGSLIEYAIAFCAMNGIRLTAKESDYDAY